MAERDPAEFVSSKLDTKAKLDLALFFINNPHTMDTAASLARWIGYGEAELAETLDEMVAAGLLRRRGSVYMLSDDPEVISALKQVARYYATAKRSVEEMVSALEAERRQLAEEIRELEVSLDAIVASMGDGLIVTDREHRVRLINPAARRLLGLGDDLVGQSILSALETEGLRELFEQAFAAEQETVRGEIDASRGGQRLFLSAQIEPIARNGDILGHVCVLSDVTELKVLDQMKSDLISFVAHELRSPLTSVKGCAHLLEEGKVGDEVRKEMLRTIASEIDRLDRMVSGFLDISRIEAGKAIELVYETFDLGQLIRDAIRMHLAASDRCPVSAEIDENVGEITADRDKVLQVLLNLLSNAAKYSPAGNPVVVRARVEGDRARIDVVDQGYGISPEQAKGLFTPFYRIRDPKTKAIRGAGVGLYLCKHLVEIHGGEITFESEPGKGTTFTVTLPLKPPQGEQ